jgi:hypothetical protein
MTPLLRRARGILLFCGLTALSDAAEGYAVRVTASIQSSPPQITLQWPGDSTATSFAVSRKPPGASAWGPATMLAGSATSYTDTTVAAGTSYEYQVVKQAAGNVTAYGYVLTAIDAPLADQRGRVVLVIDRTHAGMLENELRGFVRNLIGDGWAVARIDVSPSDSPAAVRESIRAIYRSDPAGTRAVILFGHVPVVRSGNLNVDGHGGRPLPADVFYGDMDGTWFDSNGDGVYDHDTLPSDVELEVGRIDFADLPVGGAAEGVLLQQYLFKNHDFRHAVRRPPSRALIGDRFGPRNGEAFAASAYRAFPALVGNENLIESNTADNAPVSTRWISQLTTADYLWVYGAGGGADDAIGFLGTHGQFNDVWSADLVQQRARGTFYLLFGSWFVDWSRRDNILRATLAVPEHGLIAAWSGRPHLFFHPMGLGQTAGAAIRLSQNNATLYRNQVNPHARGIHIALLGDPTLRQQIVAPPRNVSAAASGAGVSLSWNASPDAVAGYHVYRGTQADGPFARVTPTPVSGTSFSDAAAPAGNLTYLVRAVRLERTPSGTFFNASQAAFAEVTVGGPANPAPAPSPAPAPGPSPAPSPGSGGGGGGGAMSWFALAATALLACLRRGRRGAGVSAS